MAATAASSPQGKSVRKPDFKTQRKHFIFTDEHEQLRESIRNFALKELAPHAEEWEETTFPDSVFQRMGELGFLGLDKPEQYGGQGGDYYSALVLAEEITNANSGGLAMGVAVHTDMAMPPFEQTINMPDGGSRQLLWRAKGIFDSLGTLQEVQAVGIDITRMRQFEIELARNQKLESLGVLAGGIAHDFNNMLVAIVNNTEIVMLDKSVDEKHIHRLKESVNSAMRARKLTQQLLTFSKGGAPIKEHVDLISLIHSSVDFVLAGSRISVLYDIDEGLRKVSADPGQVEQVINNLVLNAVQAMPRGGRIYVMAGNVRAQELSPESLDAGPWVQLRITDEGVVFQGRSAKDIRPLLYHEG